MHGFWLIWGMVILSLSTCVINAQCVSVKFSITFKCLVQLPEQENLSILGCSSVWKLRLYIVKLGNVDGSCKCFWLAQVLSSVSTTVKCLTTYGSQLLDAPGLHCALCFTRSDFTPLAAEQTGSCVFLVCFVLSCRFYFFSCNSIFSF